ncbi:MAG TPA: hypothetical protein PLH94_02525 [Fimbriimonadaceae bacterium]|nr:hypothetical protein [Fimbriimonadaceae bacterium]
MNSLTLFLLFGAMQDSPMIDTRVLTSRGMELILGGTSLRQRANGQWTVLCRGIRRADTAFVGVRFDEADQRTFVVAKLNTALSNPPIVRGSASGLPLGVDAIRLYDDSDARLHIATGYGQIVVEFGINGTISARGSRVAPPQDWAQWDPWIEDFARSIVARSVNRRLEPAPTSRIDGTDVETFRCRISEGKYYKLRDWATARDYTIRVEENLVRLNRGTREVVVPVGAAKVKVSGRWIDLPDLVAERNGSWYVPEEIDRVAR